VRQPLERRCLPPARRDGLRRTLGALSDLIGGRATAGSPAIDLMW
jgi:hypothetical protein